MSQVMVKAEIDKLVTVLLDDAKVDVGEVPPRRLRRFERRVRRGQRRAIEVRVTSTDPVGGGLACPTCGSPPNVYCRSRANKKLAWIHRARRNLGMKSIPSCEGCGVCCLTKHWGSGKDSDDKPFVQVFGHEPVPSEMLQPNPAPVFGEPFVLKIMNGRCLALVGETPGARCAIYPVRPLVCRKF